MRISIRIHSDTIYMKNTKNKRTTDSLHGPVIRPCFLHKPSVDAGQLNIMWIFLPMEFFENVKCKHRFITAAIKVKVLLGR